MDGTSERQRSQLLGTGSVSSTTGTLSTTELFPVPLPGPPNPPAALARGHADRAGLADEAPRELADFSEVGWLPHQKPVKNHSRPVPIVTIRPRWGGDVAEYTA